MSAPSAARLWYKVTLRRSTIGLPETTKVQVKRMGLTRMQKSMVMPATATNAASLLKIKELIEVENVTLPTGVRPKVALKNLHAARKPFAGFAITGNALQKSWQ
ncbi:hypothetical protein BC828DRAFT_372254 [Blastocladiella britannica]|nr:hypothetical protein BC828DRAFT_372254 [Blastocladiella britannica]